MGKILYFLEKLSRPVFMTYFYLFILGIFIPILKVIGQFGVLLPVDIINSLIRGKVGGVN